MNLLDGSSVWLQSVVQLLAELPTAAVTVLLRAPRRRDLLTAPLDALENVSVLDPPSERRALKSAEAAEWIAEVDANRPFDRLLIRGAGVEKELTKRERFTGRLWPYYVPTMDAGLERERVAALVRGGALILCQTEAIRTAILAHTPEAAGRLLLLGPMVPAEAFELAASAAPNATRLAYAGKLAPEYHFFEMVELLQRVRVRHPNATLDIVGDKIHNPPADPGFRRAAEDALRATDGLRWHGGVSRTAALSIVAQSGLALSIRAPHLSASVELSTKILEYGALRRPVVLNRTAAHEELLGSEYPFFAEDAATGAAAVERAITDPSAAALAADRCYDASREYAITTTAKRLGSRLIPRGNRGPPAVRRVTVAGHNLGFVEPVLAALSARGAEMRRDIWKSHVAHDAESSGRAVDWADAVLCEWCLGNALFYSRRRLHGQRLLIHFHRMELETPHPAQLDLDRVDRVIFVADHVRDEAMTRFGWDADRLIIIPNAIDLRRFDRPKLPGSEFNLGVVGYVPQLKRLDRALDVLERLRARESRFRLIAKGRSPTEIPWMLRRPHELAYFEALSLRIARSPLLRGAVSFEEHGSDLPTFYERISFGLSVSEIEGHAVALAEAMAARCVPVVLERPGAEAQYPAEWIHPDAEAAALSILNTAALGRTPAEGERARAWASAWDAEALAPTWRALLGIED